ncbi:MAG: hypothetical protein WCD35_07710 [Mycobacteriales bacterium]
MTRCRLDLAGRSVLTEAATGPYASTAVLAAMAGAEVTALARATSHGSVDEIRAWTRQLACTAGVAGQIDIVQELTPAELAGADIVTNSGHLRPLDGALLAQLKPTAVVPLMMEAWEIGAGRADVDLDEMRRRGIAFAGTNERCSAVGVFDYLGVMALKLLVDAGVAVVGTELLLLCDNAFSEYLQRTLRACGARVTVLSSPEELASARRAEAVLVSLTPSAGPRVARQHLSVLSELMPGVVIAQFFGDVDRQAARSLGLACWPEGAPQHGHMGVLPSDIGPEPVVRLQAGGLKVGQVLLTPVADRTPFDLGFLDLV